jgi:8-oxo-dGTP pyrophosphatase MutT (NUDIX family)
VGGHVERGESLIGALGREVEEETGWSLTGIPSLTYVGDWESSQDGVKRREFDFLVQISGNLDRPRLERPKHIEFR